MALCLISYACGCHKNSRPITKLTNRWVPRNWPFRHFRTLIFDNFRLICVLDSNQNQFIHCHQHHPAAFTVHTYVLMLFKVAQVVWMCRNVLWLIETEFSIKFSSIINCLKKKTPLARISIEGIASMFSTPHTFSSISITLNVLRVNVQARSLNTLNSGAEKKKARDFQCVIERARLWSRWHN